MTAPALLTLLMATAFAGGLVQGVAGFGFGMVAMALYSQVLGVRAAVPLVSILGVTVGVTVLLRMRRHIVWRDVAPMVAGGALGIPLGVAYLAHVDAKPLLGTLGALIVVYALWSLLGRSVTRPDERPPPGPGRAWGALAGWIGGLTGGAFNIGGPPVVVHALVRRWPQPVFVGTLQAYFVMMTAFQLTLLVHQDIANRESLEFALLASPALVGGVLLGARLARRLDPTGFRRVVYVLLIVLGATLLHRGLT